MIEDYLHKSKEIRCVFLLVDIRHEPGNNDKIMYKWILDHGYEPVIIATKLDKIKRSLACQTAAVVFHHADVLRADTAVHQTDLVHGGYAYTS